LRLLAGVSLAGLVACTDTAANDLFVPDLKPVPTLAVVPTGNALEAALMAHPALTASRASLEAARARIREAESGLLPQIDVGVDAGWSSADIRQPQATGAPVTTASVALRQLLQDGGQTRANIQRSEVELVQAELDFALRGDQLIEELIAAWIARDAANRSLRVIARHIGDFERRRPQIDAASAGGMLTNAEMIEIDAVLNQIETQRLEARISAEHAEATLAAILGAGAVSGPSGRTLATLLAQSGGKEPAKAPPFRRLAIDAGVARIEALQLGAQAAARPSASLQAQLGAPLYKPTAVRGFIGLNVSWNAYDGGATQAQVRAFAAERLAAINSVEALDREIAASDVQYQTLRKGAARRRGLLDERQKLSRQRIEELERLLVAGRSDVGSLAKEIIAGAEAELGIIALDADLRGAQLAAFALRGGACALIEACNLLNPVVQP